MKLSLLQKDCYEVYALVPGLLREEVRIHTDISVLFFCCFSTVRKEIDLVFYRCHVRKFPGLINASCFLPYVVGLQFSLHRCLGCLAKSRLIGLVIA